MILVEATWEDEGGALQRFPACMEGRSASGACLGVKTPNAVGSKLMIQCGAFLVMPENRTRSLHLCRYTPEAL